MNSDSSGGAFTRAEIREQVRLAVDPDIDALTLIESDLADADLWLHALDQATTQQVQSLRRLKEDYRELLISLQDALEFLVPLGWAPFLMESSAGREAIRRVKAGQAHEADELLADQWQDDGAWRTKQVCDRVHTMGSGARQTKTEDLFANRARLLRKAKAHHEAGRYDASIPILQAQMEGIVMDVAQGKKFFTKSSQKAEVADPIRLVTVKACLPVLQRLYGEDVPSTQAAGALSRHGVAHGRELAYDTRVNSAKCWSVLDAIVEWAMPIAHDLAEAQLAAQQAARAGSRGVDEAGRQLDDREFRETQNVLIRLGNSAYGHRRQTGRFRTDLIGGVYTDQNLASYGLPLDHGLQMEQADETTAWFWRRTISGWVLAYAVSATAAGMTEWFYSSQDAPSGPPGSSVGWSEPYLRPADWS